MRVPSMTGWTRAKYLDFCDEVRTTLYEPGNATLRKMVLDEAAKTWDREHCRQAMQTQRSAERHTPSLFGEAVRA